MTIWNNDFRFCVINMQLIIYLMRYSAIGAPEVTGKLCLLKNLFIHFHMNNNNAWQLLANEVILLSPCRDNNDSNRIRYPSGTPMFRDRLGHSLKMKSLMGVYAIYAEVKDIVWFKNITIRTNPTILCHDSVTVLTCHQCSIALP